MMKKQLQKLLGNLKLIILKFYIILSVIFLIKNLMKNLIN
jgi:hypothetical protein